jgi:tRNA-dihydrouridine synthase
MGDFQHTKPPTFSYAVEPMDANDWLKSIEKKLQVMQYNNCEKVLLASHQLSGPTSDWWDAYVEAHEEPESINWPEFRATFCAHHVSQGVIKLKKKEFQDLKQRSMSVNKYATKFTQLSHYALHEVDTDEKKHECFLNGLNDGLAYASDARDFENFQGMVNKALVLENHRGVIEHKRKLVCQHQSSSSSKPQVATSLVGPVFHPAQPQF